MTSPSAALDAVLASTGRAAALRAAAGAIAGWTIVERWASAGVPGWWAPYVAVWLAVALAVAPEADRWAGRGITSGWALSTAIGLYVGVPETDRIVGIVAVLAVIVVGELTGRMRVDGLIVIGLDGVLVWAAVQGAVDRSGAMVAGVAVLGLLVVAPIVAEFFRPHRSRPVDPVIATLLVALQFVFAIGVARLGGVRTTTGESIRVVAIAVPLLALASVPLLARRSAS